MTTVNTPTTSITGIVFSIRTARPLDLPTVRSAILRTGFVRSVHGMALIAHKADAALAVLDYSSHLSQENLTDRINVELGRGIERGMGSRLVADLEHLASDLDATICNGDGEVLALEALNALAAEIDAMAAQRIDNPPALPVEPSKPLPAPPIRQPDGTMRVPGILSFTHEVTTARGKWLDEVHFDSQPMTYYAGQREGMRRAAELLACIKASKPERLNTKRIIAAAFGVDIPRVTFSKPTADNVASGFIDMIVRMVESAAKTNNHAAYIEQAIARSLESEADMAEYERDRHHKIGVKAAATRAARRAAKGVPA